MKRRLFMAIIFAVAGLGITACVQSPADSRDPQAVSAEEEARRERLQEAAELRAKLQKSELKTYTLNYLQALFAEVYPDVNLSGVEFAIEKNKPTQEEVDPLNGDEEKAFQLMRDADFTISIMKSDGTPCIPQEERKAFLNALGERGFTAHVELGFYEYEYIVGGEVHVEPKPMY